MKKIIATIALLAVFLTACGGGSASTEAQSVTPSSTHADESAPEATNSENDEIESKLNEIKNSLSTHFKGNVDVTYKDGTVRVASWSDDVTVKAATSIGNIDSLADSVIGYYKTLSADSFFSDNNISLQVDVVDGENKDDTILSIIDGEVAFDVTDALEVDGLLDEDEFVKGILDKTYGGNFTFERKKNVVTVYSWSDSDTKLAQDAIDNMPLAREYWESLKNSKKDVCIAIWGRYREFYNYPVITMHTVADESCDNVYLTIENNDITYEKLKDG